MLRFFNNGVEPLGSGSGKSSRPKLNIYVCPKRCGDCLDGREKGVRFPNRWLNTILRRALLFGPGRENCQLFSGLELRP